MKDKNLHQSKIFLHYPLTSKLIPEKCTKFTKFFYVVIIFSVIPILKIYYFVGFWLELTQKGKKEKKSCSSGQLSLNANCNLSLAVGAAQHRAERV